MIDESIKDSCKHFEIEMSFKFDYYETKKNFEGIQKKVYLERMKGNLLEIFTDLIYDHMDSEKFVLNKAEIKEIED